MSQALAFERFRDMHDQASLFVMPNPWDGGSAAVMKRAGFKALASSSFALAATLGRQDGARAVSRTEAIAHAGLLWRVTGLPVNGDLEDGYGPEPADCAATVEAAIEGGLAGLSIEDTTADPNQPIHPFDDAVERVRAAASAARGRIVLTARADGFLHGQRDLHDVVRRLVAFAEVGADVLYAPFLPDIDAVATVVRAVAPKPVNVLGVGVDLPSLTSAGVCRVSLGGALYQRALGGLVAALDAVGKRDLGGAVEGAISIAELVDVLRPAASGR